MPAIDGLKLIEPRSYSEHGYPYSEWAELRDDPRLRWFEPEGWPGFWAIGKHADIVEVSKQPARFLNAPGMVMVRARENTQEGEQQIKTIINMDPPEHRKFRAVASPFFTPRALAQLDTLVEETATKLVDGLGSEGECDFIADIASIHPLKVIARILGVPEADEPFILKLTNELFGAEDPEFQRSEDRLEGMKALFMDFWQYFGSIIEDRRVHPTEDLASVFANAKVDGEQMGPIETLGYFLIAFTAGHETTRGAIGGGMQALIQNPAQLAMWKANPDITKLAVDEIVRYVTPVNHMVRTAAEETNLRGQTIRKGDKLVLFYASANRDEEVFDQPNALQLDRRPNPHLGFGIGEHFCLGAHLARMTTGSILGTLVSRLEEVELTGPLERTASNLVPGIKHMPIRYALSGG